MNQQAQLKVTVTNGPRSLLHSQHSQVSLLSPVTKLIGFPPEDHIHSNSPLVLQSLWSESSGSQTQADLSLWPRGREFNCSCLKEYPFVVDPPSTWRNLLESWLVGVAFLKSCVMIKLRII